MKKQFLLRAALLFFSIFFFHASFSADYETQETLHNSMDRMQLLDQQIQLLSKRLDQSKSEYVRMQANYDKKISEFTIENASKNILDKAKLDVTVAKSSAESLTIEITDSRQTRQWIEKNIHEIENQLNAAHVFGLKASQVDALRMRELQADLTYQKKLLSYEMKRGKILLDLQVIAQSVLQLSQDFYNRLESTLKSKKLLFLKQQQAKDELLYQEKQNEYLKRLNGYYSEINKIDPAQEKERYVVLERRIFLDNQYSNYFYIQSLIARYQDQMHQIRSMMLKGNSIGLLHEISDQLSLLLKQLTRLTTLADAQFELVKKHIDFFSKRKFKNESSFVYVGQLKKLHSEYAGIKKQITEQVDALAVLRMDLDKAMQTELSMRQGVPAFSNHFLFDLGKEIISLPTLTFQFVKSLIQFVFHAVQKWGFADYFLIFFVELMFGSAYVYLKRFLEYLPKQTVLWGERFTFRRVGAEWLKRNLIYLMLFLNWIVFGYFIRFQKSFFDLLNGIFLVFLTSTGMVSLLKISLLESTHEHFSGDAFLFRALRKIIWIGFSIIAITLFIDQLPLIYELKYLWNYVFLIYLIMLALVLLRSREIIPRLIMSHFEMDHPYLKKSIRLLVVLTPIILFANAVMGLLGYMNLVLSLSWYQGLFLVLLIGYLIVRGFLSDGMEYASHLLIRHTKNGWLWTEAFLKPFDHVLRLALFILFFVSYFYLCGIDSSSPVYLRMLDVLNIPLIHILNTSITPKSMIYLVVMVSVFYWMAKWTREFMYRLLSFRTKDMGIKNSLAILSQYLVVLIGFFTGLRLLGIDLQALAFVSGMLALGVGWGLRDLVNNFACGFLILLERPLRVGDLVCINEHEGEVVHIGGRAVTVRSWDHMDVVVPNAEIFNKLFINWTARDNIVRSNVPVKISRYDDPHRVRELISQVLANHRDILKEPSPEVLLKEMTDSLIEFEVRYYVNIRQVRSRMAMMSSVLILIWDEFAKHGIKPPYPHQEIVLKKES